ncbi:dual specificity phosphatase [Loa loa]|uniref:Dual specificity phosphatase n=1 Tax=Loa loa TaxID=7209 RepID=A0A1I7V5U7_LOALO|nr:dual specificity phosphatase [Loa loa]EFO18445.1 dual specificity phosphatase [Loa loa]
MTQRSLRTDKLQRDEKRCLQQIIPNPHRFPDRWIDYDPVGKDMPGTRFVAFKTPLRHSYFLNRGDEFDVENIFETKNLLHMANAAGKQIGLVIDLTATTKYYDPREWTDVGVKYEKIWCMGHHINIQVENIEKFYNVVNDFLSKHVHTGELIGVHCTHGLNRTGYMICRYLIEVDGWDVDSAIEQFEYCRGYKIERKKYIDSLRDDCVRRKHAILSVEYPGKHVNGILDKRQAHLKNVLPCIDLNEFVAAT